MITSHSNLHDSSTTEAKSHALLFMAIKKAWHPRFLSSFAVPREPHFWEWEPPAPSIFRLTNLPDRPFWPCSLRRREGFEVIEPCPWLLGASVHSRSSCFGYVVSLFRQTSLSKMRRWQTHGWPPPLVFSSDVHVDIGITWTENSTAKLEYTFNYKSIAGMYRYAICWVWYHRVVAPECTFQSLHLFPIRQPECTRTALIHTTLGLPWVDWSRDQSGIHLVRSSGGNWLLGFHFGRICCWSHGGHVDTARITRRCRRHHDPQRNGSRIRLSNGGKGTMQGRTMCGGLFLVEVSYFVVRIEWLWPASRANQCEKSADSDFCDHKERLPIAVSENSRPLSKSANSWLLVWWGNFLSMSLCFHYLFVCSTSQSVHWKWPITGWLDWKCEWSIE